MNTLICILSLFMACGDKKPPPPKGLTAESRNECDIKCFPKENFYRDDTKQCICLKEDVQ